MYHLDEYLKSYARDASEHVYRLLCKKRSLFGPMLNKNIYEILVTLCGTKFKENSFSCFQAVTYERTDKQTWQLL
jgi:hypothetical protein